ncbi:MAG: hypothetical protein Aurels2KO_10660 [Aureliella sp.]
MVVLIAETRFVEIEMTPEGETRYQRCRKETLCCACEEPIVAGEKVVRQMHERCSKATWRMIDAGHTTEEERVRQGKMGPGLGRRGRISNPVTKEFLGDQS